MVFSQQFKASFLFLIFQLMFGKKLFLHQSFLIIKLFFYEIFPFTNFKRYNFIFSY